MSKEYKPINNLWKDSEGYRYFGTLKLSSKIKYNGADFISLWEWVEQLQQENQQLKIQISAREEECKKLYETNKVLSQELTKDKLLKQDHLTTCCGIPIGDIPKLIEKNKKLEDNWNELKGYAKDNLYFYSGYQGEDLEIDIAIQGVLDKMKELERGVNK